MSTELKYSRPRGPVVFDFRMSRARESPAEFLASYGGIFGQFASMARRARFAIKQSDEGWRMRALLEWHSLGAILSGISEIIKADLSRGFHLESREDLGS